jgi:hypothetical protein
VAPDRIVAVVMDLVGQGDFVTLGRLLDTATESIVRDVTATAPTEALLQIGFYAESDEQLTRVVALLPPARLRGIVRDALAGPPELRAAGLALVGRLTDDDLRGRLTEYAAEADDETLTRLLHTAIDEGALAELLTAVTAMSEQAQLRMLTLPALAEPHILGHLVRAVEKHGLWPRIAPLVSLMDDDLRHRIAAAAEGRTNFG